MQTVLEAVYFSSVAHTDQRRKDSAKSPYINHPVEVMNILSRYGVKDVDTLCAAVLHDTVEDTVVTEQDLVEKFGQNIAKIVMECSDDKSLPKEVRKQKQIEHADHISDSAKLVKLADKISNLSGLLTNPPTSWSEDEIKGYFFWALAVCRKLMGLNEKLDEHVASLFRAADILDTNDEQLNEELEKYYKLICHSE